MAHLLYYINNYMKYQPYDKTTCPHHYFSSSIHVGMIKTCVRVCVYFVISTILVVDIPSSLIS